MIRVEPIVSLEELKAAVDVYVNYAKNDIVPFSREESYTNMEAHWRSLKYVKKITYKGAVVGIVCGDILKSFHGKHKFFNQMYYCTNLKGVLSVKAVQLAHRDIIEYASKYKLSYVISQASHNDTSFVFTRILEKDGWIRKGFMAIYPLSIELRQI